MLGERSCSVRRNYFMDSNIPFEQCSRTNVVMYKLEVLPKIHQAYRNDANGIRTGSNSKITDKHAAVYSKTACLELNKSVCNVRILVQQYRQKY